MAAGKGGLEKVRRYVRTIYFVVAMVASLLVLSAPILVAVAYILVPCVLMSSFTCIGCYSFKEHLRRFAVKSSLTDIPLVSVIRSLIITCVYSICDGPALSHGLYLATVKLCSLTSILLLLLKACVFTVNSQIEADASSSLARQKLHLKKSWGMPVLFLSSLAFALGHTMVAYRISCRATRKHLFHRVDQEAVLSGKFVFSGFQKVPRSPIPSAGRKPKSDSEMREKPGGISRYEGELPVRFLADIDSLFINCQGLTLHYKLSMSGLPPRSLFSTTFSNRPSLNIQSKTQYHLHRSFSNHTSSLCAPLFGGSATSPVLSDKIPILILDDPSSTDEFSISRSPVVEQDLEANGESGIALMHGFGGGVFSWRHLMGVLAQQVDCTVAAFDRPGCGLTLGQRRKDWEKKQLPNPYKLESQVDLLLSFCSELGFSSVILVGHDDGGLLALKTAQRVRALPNSVNVPLHAEGWDEALHEIGKLSFETVLSQQYQTSLLQAVEDLPVLVVAGAEDALVPLKSAQAMASKFVNSKLVAISGCGHLPHEECPKALLAAISPFISRLLKTTDLESQ